MSADTKTTPFWMSDPRAGHRFTPEELLVASDKGLDPYDVRRLMEWLHGLVTNSHKIIDPTATIDPTTQIWHYAVILADVWIGPHCSIGSHTEIGRGSKIARNSRIGAFCFLPSNTQIGSGVFVGPHVMMCDDKRPFVHGVSDAPYNPEPPVIGDGASIGAGAILAPGVHIGSFARIGMGAIVTKDVPADGFVRCEPARAFSMPEGWQNTATVVMEEDD